jgi:hypothetical protein
VHYEALNMSKREVCFIIGKGGAILWADASDSPVALPDTRDRWNAIWDNREHIENIAHSHPNGPAAFSLEDETTMEALSSALGKTIRFSVVAPSAVIAREGDNTFEINPAPWWAELLRLASGMETNEEA